MLTGPDPGSTAVPLEILVFDATACGFPRPRVPLLPDGFSGLSFRAGPAARATAAAHFRHFSRGRYALREACRLAGLGSGSALLAPAYHCRTMIDPALALGADVLLYPLRPDLLPDLDAIDGLLRRSPLPVKALLATHFFGFPQALGTLSAWCAARGITLVEDCSHALFTEGHQAPGTGAFGDFVVSSPYKFFPSPDGGVLYGRRAERLDELAPRAPSAAAELRGLARALAAARAHRRSRRGCNARTLDAELAAIAANPGPPGSDSRQDAGCSDAYRPGDEGLASLRLSRLIRRHTDIAAMARRRREHYRGWAEALAAVPGCRPLFPQLPDGCVPYMFPLYIENPGAHFYHLKHLGVPLWRWDSMGASDCPTANDYRFRLLHLPCHQALDPSELEWMIAAVRKVMALPSRSGA